MDTYYPTYVERRIVLATLDLALTRLPLEVMLACHGISTALPYTTETNQALGCVIYTKQWPRVLRASV